MDHSHNPFRRFGMTVHEAAQARRTAISNTPPLPAVDYAAVGERAPVLLTTLPNSLPKATAVVITWAEAEWAALQQVFCQGSTPMPYADRTRGDWPGWETYAQELPGDAPSDWTEWGSTRLVEVAGRPVLLFKSNTHLDYPGAAALRTLIERLIAAVAPSLILSIGTAGGADPGDHIGTVRAVSAGTLYETGTPAADWPDYRNGWTATATLLDDANFNRLLLPIPTTVADLETLAASLNAQHRTSYTLSQLDPDGLNRGDAAPQVHDQTGGNTALLTTPTFVVGTTAGDYATYAAIEMDDALIGEVCAAAGVSFGFIRNISDPVQSAALPANAQGNWGGVVYDAYGFYTSYNGALAAWAVLAALG